MNVGLVKTPAGTYRPCPTRVAIVSCSNVMRGKKFAAGFVVHAAVFYVTHFADRRVDKAMTERDIACRSDTE